jgi:tetraacyldisaccharide 4'-kinase
METILTSLWYTQSPWRWVLYPFSLIYQAISLLRRAYLCRFRQQHFEVPILVVGNVTVGGVGKTPFVIALARHCQEKGVRVGIVSRGYGASIKQFPHEVLEQDSAYDVGDEPLLLAKRTSCPVVIAPDRVQAVRYLLEKHACQLIISDDGLQHYKLARAIDIVVMDGVRGLGNGLCLPAGPLREPASGLKRVDFIVVNGGVWPDGYQMTLAPGALTRLTTGDTIEVADLPMPVAAVAGIGHPQRFFSTLQSLGIVFHRYPFPDHHPFRREELQVSEQMVVMTEKDAVKCGAFATDAMCFLPVDAMVCDAFWHALWSHKQLEGLCVT